MAECSLKKRWLQVYVLQLYQYLYYCILFYIFTRALWINCEYNGGCELKITCCKLFVIKSMCFKKMHLPWLYRLFSQPWLLERFGQMRLVVVCDLLLVCELIKYALFIFIYLMGNWVGTIFFGINLTLRLKSILNDVL